MSDKLREEIEEELKAKTLDQWDELSESKGTSFARRGALLQRCLSELDKSRWIPVEEFTSDHAEDDGLYALVCNKQLDVHCAVTWLGDNNWQCVEGGELIEWLPTHAMLLPRID